MLFKNVAGQKIHVYAFDSTDDSPKTGDAANITAYVSLDGTANAIDDTNPTEVDATNMPGVYVFDLAQAETNCNSFALYAKSSTSNIRIEPIIGFTTGDANSLSVNTAQFAGQTITCAGGVTIPAATLASTTNITSANGVTLTPTTGLGNQTANITGTVSGNSTHSAADVKTAIEAAGSHLTLVLADTDELQKDITDGGRTDNLIDAIKAKTDLMLAAADIRTAVGLAAANLDTQIATLATAANLATLDTLVDRMAPLLVGNVTGAGTGTEVYAYGGVTVTVTVDVDGNVSGVVFS